MTLRRATPRSPSPSASRSSRSARSRQHRASSRIRISSSSRRCRERSMMRWRTFRSSLTRTSSPRRIRIKRKRFYATVRTRICSRTLSSTARSKRTSKRRNSRTPRWQNRKPRPVLWKSHRCRSLRSSSAASRARSRSRVPTRPRRSPRLFFSQARRPTRISTTTVGW